MRKSKATIFWDSIRHLLVLVSTFAVLYFFWTRIHWALGIIAGIPAYYLMGIIFEFLTSPLYFLTPERKVFLMAERALGRGDSSASRILEAYENGELGYYTEAIQAIDSLNQVIRTQPDFAEAHCDLGRFYGELGCYAQAVESLKRAIRIKPTLAEAHNNLGIVYGLLGRYTDAIEAYNQAIHINPGFVEGHFNLGVAYMTLGDLSSAFEQYEILKDTDKKAANRLFSLIHN